MKLEIEELSVGNYVEYSGKLIDWDSNCYDQWVGDMEKETKPIPLTQEWTEKFGFTFQKAGNQGADMWQGLGYWGKECAGGRLVLRGDRDCHYCLRVSGFLHSEIRYVHQLQNLYRSITGNTLTLET